MSRGTRWDTAGHGTNCPEGGGWDTPFRGGVPPQPPVSIGAKVNNLARKVGRLSPNWRDPERYFEERDELEKALRRLARQIEVQGG